MDGKRLVFFNIAAQGHVRPTCHLVRQLIACGAEVMYFCCRTLRDLIEESGATFTSYPGYEEKDFRITENNPGKSGIHGIFPTCLKLIPRLLEHLSKERKLDMIVYDNFAPWGYVLGKKLGVPAVCSNSGAIADRDDLRIFATWGDERLKINHICKNAADELKKKFDFNVDWSRALDCFSDELTLVYTSAEFHPFVLSRTPLSKFTFIGHAPLEGRPKHSESDLVFLEKMRERRKGHSHLVYVSFGTVIRRGKELWPMFYDAFPPTASDAFLNPFFLVACADWQDPNPPSNFLFHPFCPQVEVLKLADLLVFHGGMGSTQESLLTGVPSVCVPHHADQHTIADRLEELGCAIVIKERNFNSQTLRSAVLQILESPEGYEKNIEDVRKSLQAIPKGLAIREMVKLLPPVGEIKMNE